MNRSRHAGQGLSTVITATLAACSLALAACDNKPAPAPSGGSNSDFPSTTQLGKSRDMARDIGAKIGNSQDAALNSANEGLGGGTTVADVKFQAPKSWTSTTPQGGMRAAEFKVPGSAGEATVWFTHFAGGQGGDPASNVSRWQGQFKSADGSVGPSTVSNSTVDAMRTTRVVSTGTYMSGMPGTPLVPVANQMGIGYIVEAPRGFIFVRIVGPTATVQAAEKDFDAMINGMKKN